MKWIIGFILCGFLQGCVQSNPMPQSLKDGRGSAIDAENHARTLFFPDRPILFIDKNLDKEGLNARFFYDPQLAGNGGNAYETFLIGKEGYQYLGRLEFAEFCVLPHDSQNRPRIATLWYSGVSEGYLTVHVLKNGAFEKVFDIKVNPSVVQDTPLFGLSPTKTLAIMER